MDILNTGNTGLYQMDINLGVGSNMNIQCFGNGNNECEGVQIYSSGQSNVTMECGLGSGSVRGGCWQNIYTYYIRVCVCVCV